MGSVSSKAEKDEPLRLCKERRRFIKQTIDSRYNLAAAHVSYTSSLRNIGIALRRFAEAEVLIESSLSTTSATELDKTPSHTSYPSPSPSHIADVSDSPLHNESPISPPVVNMSYMRAAGGGGSAVTVKVNLNGGNGFVEDKGFPIPMPPPPPPFQSGGSWDYFDTSDDCKSFRFMGQSEFDVDFDDMGGWHDFKAQKLRADQHVVDAKGKWAQIGLDGSNNQVNESSFRPGLEQKGLDMSGNLANRNGGRDSRLEGDFHAVSLREVGVGKEIDGQVRQVETTRNGHSSALENSGSRREKASAAAAKDLSSEREDPSEFITHRAKDFLSSIKDIEHRFFRASESGKEVSRKLEANNIRVGYCETKGQSSASEILAAFKPNCCRGKNSLVSHEPVEHITKVITWKRTTSSRSSSSRYPFATSAKDDVSDSGSDFTEDFCMIAGSHSSTLDRLYAWERKLYDEVKASESIRKEYDRRCDQLRRQFAKDCSTQVIDKTRAVVKDLHSRIKVAIHSVDTISKRIEKMRDEELRPQLMELIQGLTRMWKAMLECHHAQYITISLAYHSRSTAGSMQGDSRQQILAQLQEEVECFGLSFANWVNSLASYVEALNAWLQNCILQPQERSKHRRPFSPRRVLAPPIFVLCRDWSAGIKALPSEELSNGIKAFLSDLRHLMEQQAVQTMEQQANEESMDANNGELDGKDVEKPEVSSNLCCVHSSLTKVLDKLNKFSEASLKMYEDVRQKSEAARVAYSNYKPVKY